ncbi:MAG TPA: hypothetical protein DEP87_00760 [Candidatus Pacebacteria bacterium]|nr:hypothetical protein [Candidatus Paceibacterota bacterium]
MKLSWLKVISLGVGLYSLGLVLSWGNLAWQIRQKHWQNLSQSAQLAQITLQPLRLVTFYHQTEIEVLNQGLSWIMESDRFVQATIGYGQVLWPESAAWTQRQSRTLAWQEQFQDWVKLTNQLLERAQTSFWWRLMPLKYRSWPYQQWLTEAETLVTTLSQGQKTWLILFQNSQELRATGGFIGSYAKLDFQEGILTQFEIQDIYQPDGQFQGFIPAPTGVAEYLSSGQGLRLPDANWWPDFPKSAQTMLQYFALGKEQHVIGVAAVNLALVEDLVRIFGPIQLTDYNVTVTADNLSEVARADRAKFFPGSQQKAHFLSQLFNQLKLRLETAAPEEVLALIKIWSHRAASKDWQWYSPDENLAAISRNLGLAGQTSLNPQVFGQITQPENFSLPPLYLELVESNVGINKANSGITREVTLQLLAVQLQVLINFTNHHLKPAVTPAELRPDLVIERRELANGLGYVNYQRLLCSPYLRPASIFVGDQSVANWDEELITLSGVLVRQIGFMVTLPEASSQRVQVILELDSSQAPVTNLLTLPALTIQKQAGLPPTPYEFFGANQRHNWVLETDTQILLQ